MNHTKCMHDHTLNPFSLHQDHVFRIDPSKVEDGKGKSPYDPRHNAASVLVGELINFRSFLEEFKMISVDGIHPAISEDHIINKLLISVVS